MRSSLDLAAPSQAGLGGDEATIGKTEFDRLSKEAPYGSTAFIARFLRRAAASVRTSGSRASTRLPPQDFDLAVEPLRDASGAVIGIIAAATDITERKKAQEALALAKAEAERANVAKSKFLATASDDLRHRRSP